MTGSTPPPDSDTCLLPLSEPQRQRVIHATSMVETPFFLLDIGAVRERFRSFRAAWARSFRRLSVAYSYKTNGLAAVTGQLLDEGASAEVVSGIELDWALADGARPADIYFDGPCKLEPELARALQLGIQIQIDSVEEAATIARLLQSIPSTSTLRLRLATPRPGQTWSRFGLFEDEIFQATLLLEQAGRKVQGLHLHVGSNVGTDLHAVAIEAYAEVIGWFREYAGAEFSLDIGGGYAASTASGAAPPAPELYARNVAASLTRIGLDPETLRLVVEPGRCLVEDAGLLVTRVISCKRRGAEHYVACDAGTSLVRSAISWRHTIHTLDEQREQGSQHFVLVGANCFESDVLSPRLLAAALPRAAELLVIGACGGYDIASSAGWIRPRAPVVAMDRAHFSLARQRQMAGELRGCRPSLRRGRELEHSLDVGEQQ